MSVETAGRSSVVAVANQKGGVGKTTVTMQVAAVLARRYRVLMVDVDPQQSSAWWAENAGDALPFDYSATRTLADVARLRELGGDYDVTIVDTPGSLEDVRTLETVLDLADFAVVPMPPEALAANPTERTISRLIEPRRLDYAVLLNRIDPHVPKQLEDWAAFLDTCLGVPRFAAHMRQYRVHANAPLTGEVITSTPDTRRTSQAIWDATAVAFELAGRLAPAKVWG